MCTPEINIMLQSIVPQERKEGGREGGKEEREGAKKERKKKDLASKQ